MPTLATITTVEAHAAQKEFDSKYITSSEIMTDLGISRTAIYHARERGLLPNTIVVNNGQLCLWLRTDIAVQLEAWRVMTKLRKGNNE